MKLTKKISVGGAFAKVNEDLKDEDVIKILNSGQELDFNFGPQQIFKITTRTGEKVLSFNQTSLNNLIDTYGEDTEQWIGKEARVHILRVLVSGKMRNVVYLAEPSWILTEDGQLVPSSSEKAEEESIEDIPCPY